MVLGKFESISCQGPKHEYNFEFKKGCTNHGGLTSIQGFVDSCLFNLEIFLARSFPLNPMYSNSKFLLKFNIRDGVLNHTY